MTHTDTARARTFGDVFPSQATKPRRGRGPQKGETKALVSLRLDREILTRFRADGPGWQTRINAALRRAIQD